MLTIITGTPGAGKTLHSLSLLKSEFEPAKGEDRRPIYVNGIKDINYEFFNADELENPEEWFKCPEGSVIFIDEAQRVFPQRSASQKVPLKCQEMATHRHKGMDLIFTTQDATNIDAFVRRMCGRHIHVHRILNRNTATIYEYDHYVSNPTGYHEKQKAISKTPWRYPKKIFDKYKSATIHTHKAKTPLKFYFLLAAVLVTAFAIYRSVQSFTSGEFAGENSAAKLEKMRGEDGSLNPLEALQFGGNPRTVQIAYLDQFRPRIDGIAHSAPIYDDVMQVETAPKPLCMIIKPFDSHGNTRVDGECKCFTQQITQYHTSDSFCRSWAKGGFFDFTKEDLYQQGRGSSASANRADPLDSKPVKRAKEIKEGEYIGRNPSDPNLQNIGRQPPGQALRARALGHQ